MSPDSSKPKYVLIRRTHYPIPDYEGITQEEALIARKSIIKKFKDIGIGYQPEKMTRIKLK